MRAFHPRSISLAALWVLVSVAAVQAASPRLSIILPRGVQRGAEHEVTFSGSNLGDAEEIFFYDKGFEVIKLEGNGNQCKATIRVAEDCRLGEHVAQVRTRTGISDFRTFYVGPFPSVAETEPNTDFAAPQVIAMNVTVTGIVQNEDVDYYQIEAKKGERISVEVEGMRLGITMFDPYVAILDSKRFELASADDSPLLVQDCTASAIAPEDGKYIVEVRESAYAGNGNCRYRLHVGTFPRPMAIFPAGGQPGQDVEVRYLGDPTGDIQAKVQAPSENTPEFGFFAQDSGGIAPSPNLFRVHEHPNSFEQEPNNAVAEATAVEFPSAFNGIIQEQGDADFIKFAAKKGQVFDVECFARRIRSELDPVMNIYYADGRSIAGNDDSRGPDSYIRFTVPADGEYCLRVADHLGRGGPAFVYRVEFHPIKPKLTMSIPRTERYGQYRQQIYVARGNRFATILNASRANFGGELTLDGVQLPPGITMHAVNMPANLTSMPVVFEAAADAPIGGALVDLTARHVDPNQNIVGSYFNQADFVISSPGQSRYRGRDVHKLAVAVVDELPFRLEIVQPKAPIVQNGSMALKIVAHRKEGFDEAINVQFPFRPPGIGAASSVNIAKGANEVTYPLSANGGAAVGTWKVFALGSSNVGGAAWVSSQLADLNIAAPYVTFEMQRASCEQGQPAQVYCKLNHATPFEGKAKVQLLGLPAKVTTTDLEFTKDTKELVFDVKTDPGSPAGKHKNVFAQVTITHENESITGRAGATELQIDKPLPKPVAAAPKPAAPKAEPAKPDAPKPPPAKPLSRLEKLRLAAEARRKEKAAGGNPME